MESNNVSSQRSNRTVLSDEPRLSSAALCLSLTLFESITFRPEFTHQCVEGESFRGYKPLVSVLEDQRKEFCKRPSNTNACTTSTTTTTATAAGRKTEDDAVLHKSHLGHDHQADDDHELDISITLAPSCRKCQVSMETTTSTTTTTNPAKRKAENGIDDDDINREVKKLKANESSSATTPNNETTKTTIASNTSNGSTTTMIPLSISEIQQSIAKALPEIVDSPCNDDYLSQPLGEVLTEYNKDDATFVISLADGTSQEVAEYHSQVQKLALWFIENANDVDVGNNQSGFWKVLYLFQKQKQGKGYSLVGYMTLFHFIAPFHKPLPGIVVRICQALVLPPYQGQGHGKRLMQGVYDLVHHHGKKDNGAYTTTTATTTAAAATTDDQTIVQVNVEDPAPAFIALRNKMDLKLLVEDHPEWWPTTNRNNNNNNNRTSTIMDEAFFTAISEGDALQVSAKAKITPHQIHIVNEMAKLQALLTEKKKNEELEKRFRLMVKKRLNKDHREDMSAYPTKDEKKAYLAKLFDEQYQLYQALLFKKTEK